MTIEALLESIDNRLADIAVLLNAPVSAEVAVAPAPTPAAEPPKRGRGRPARGETPPAQTTAPAAVEEVDPFDQPAPAAPAKKVTKDDVRAALEGYRGRLKAVKVAQGVTEADAQSFATQRVLAWLNTTAGTTTLAGLTEDKFGLVVDAAKTAQ